MQDQVDADEDAARPPQPQTSDQIQAAVLDVNEKLRDAEGRLREMTARTIGLPAMQEQLRQLAGLLDRIQDAEVLIDTKFEVMERTTGEEPTRDQAEKNDLYRRVQDLERRSEGLDRAAGAPSTTPPAAYQDEARARAPRRSRASTSASRPSRSKTGRNVDARHSPRAGTRRDRAVAPRPSPRRRRRSPSARGSRTRSPRASRHELHALQEELRALPLLTERVELLRAERQRLEDRTSHLEETLPTHAYALEREEEFDAARRHAPQGLRRPHRARPQLARSTTAARLTDQLLKLNQMLERMKRREVEEMERQVKELRGQQSQLKNDDE